MLPEKNLRTNLLEEQTPGKRQNNQQQSRTRRTPRSNLMNKVKSSLFSDFQEKAVHELEQREIYIEPTKWNAIKLFLANIYENFLIILGLALSIYQDDLSSFIFQLVMLLILNYSKVNTGEKVSLQKKISLLTLIALVAILITKYVMIKQLEPTLSTQLPEIEQQLRLFGFGFLQDSEGTKTFNFWKSIEFEVFAFIITLLLYIYYDKEIKFDQREEPYQYIHHSEFLKTYNSIYFMFFLTLTVDTFFSLTLIQMIVLASVFVIMQLKAIKYSKAEQVTKFVVLWCVRLITIQLFFTAFCQMAPVVEYIKLHQTLYKGMFITGLILHDDPIYAAITHTFLMCFVLGFGDLYNKTHINYEIFKQHEKEYVNPEMKENYEKQKLLDAKIQKGEAPVTDHETAHQHKRARFGMSSISHITNFKYDKFVQTYLPYVCLWMVRIITIVICYAYHGYPAFIMLTMALLSFMTPNYPFVQCSIYLYLPIFTIGFFYTYFINIPGLYLTFVNGEKVKLNPEVFQDFGRSFNYPAIEIAGMVLNIMFLILLAGSKHDLKMRRDEFRRGIFDKLTDKHSVFLWQLFFYILKRLHVFLLSAIFLFGMKELNIYYIGLMYFFVVYTSSLATFRKSGLIIVMYTAFFIWLQYLWSLLSKYVDSTSITYKVFMMLTLQTANEEKDGFQKFLEYEMPYTQWTILMVQVLMTTVNKFFLPGIVKEKSLENPSVYKNYLSLGDYYEEKCDLVLRKKFPTTARFLIRLRMIFSEMMIILILITQGFILVTQNPNLLFWGFLIFSLTLQTAVVSATEENPQMLRRCSYQSQILRIYSGWVLILQIAYHFINDKSFLAQYGFDEILNYILGDLNEYMTIIGFENYATSQRSIFAIFISQILFYITACYLEDYFNDKLELIEKQPELQRLQHEEVNQTDNNNDDHFQKQQSSVFQSSYAFSYSIRKREDEEVLVTEKEQIQFSYESVRFSIPYMIYQRINQWRVFDSICLNFHLVTATVTIILCTNWQISLFMAFYLLCNVILCIRAAKELHRNGQDMTLKTTQMDVDQAHQKNKEYNMYASRILLKIRTQQWTYQYWLLILSMIIMYPTPILTALKDRMTLAQQSTTNKAIFWLFWSGVYVSPDSAQVYKDHAFLYLMLILLIFEKAAQRWQSNRYGCSLEKIHEFKTLDEQIHLIKEGDTNYKPRNHTSTIERPQPLGEFVTVLEAQQECARVESLFRKQTDEIKENRLRQFIEMGLKRKYTIKLRNGLKIVLEQISLQLLLFSCANKSNIVSIFYLGLLLTFLLIKNKTTGMLYMCYTFGFVLAVEYLLTLTNLNSWNSPSPFPDPYDEGYPSKDIPEGEFIFPWFQKIEFLRDNLEWAHFFSIDIEPTQVNDIWFDFANLCILTIYFFNYGNQINARNIKVSFSQTRSLEDALDEYSRMQIIKKYHLKNPKKNDSDTAQPEEDDEDNDIAKKEREIDDDKYSEKAADDSLEYFLGATHYLTEIKKSLLIYSFAKKARYFSFIGLQIVTLLITFMLAIVCRSLMSIGYLVLCVPLLMQITDFFNLDKLHQEGKQWLHPHYVCKYLIIFSFIDISIQIFCQAPFYTSDYVLKQFGFDKVYIINHDVKLTELMYPVPGQEKDFISFANGGETLMFLVLKSINLFFIFLQARIYTSESFWQFIRVDLRRLLKLAQNYKKMAMTYRYNNWKLQKIVTTQQRKQKMYEGVAELRMKMNHFLKVQQALITGQPTQPRIQGSNIRQPLLEKIDEEDHKTPDVEDNRDGLAGGLDSSVPFETAPQKTFFEKKVSKRVSISKALEKEFKFANFQDLLKKDDLYFEKKEALKKMKTKLGRCGNWYLKLKKKHVNQIVFINDIGEAAQIKEQMSQGKRRIDCDLEIVMMNDIELFYQNKLNQSLQKKVRRKLGVKMEEDEIQLKDMKRTQEFIRFSHISSGVFAALLEACFSQMATIAYIFMIFSQVYNAGLVSILLPFAVFGYALLEEGRPGKQFWRAIKIYVVIILFLKFIVNLDFLNDNQDLSHTYTVIADYALFGLWRVTGITNLFLYILPEIIILGCIMGQSYYETLLGLYDKREIEIENIEEARARFLLQFNQEEKEQAELNIKSERARLLTEEQEEEQEAFALTYDEKLIMMKNDLIKDLAESIEVPKKEHDDAINGFSQIQRNRKELAEDIEKGQELQRKYSLILDKYERRQLVKQLKAKRPENQGILKNYFGKKPYFKRLFPKIKEAKPGIDFYGKITFVQFIICIYLISYYTKLDARGSQNLENSSQFSFNMVIVLFLQVFVMILERYISRTNTRVNLQKARGGKKLDDADLTSKMTLGDNPRSLSIHIQAQKTGDTILFGNSKTSASNIEQSKKILSIELQNTKMTNQQVLKWIIQWVLLILYHALVFWFFPLSSNDAIYGKPYCNEQSSQFEKYGCLSFKKNWYIIIFYLIFCYYFMLSALQIRYGYPDYKEPSSLTSTNTLTNVLLYRVFYNLPFLLELKTILDWCFQKTSLDIFQWLELAEIDSELYFFRNGNRSYYERKLGTRILRFEKCLCGCFCLGVILFFLVGPFFLFSNLSYIADMNLVTDAEIQFNLRVEDIDKRETYEFPIFYTDKPLNMFTMGEEEFVKREYDQLPETKYFLPNQVQSIRMKNSSDTEWTVSGDYRKTLNTLVHNSIYSDEEIIITFYLEYQFKRPGPELAPISSGFNSRIVDFDEEDDFRVLAQLDEVLSMDCEQNPHGVSGFRLDHFVPYQLRLGEQKDVINLPLPKENVTLSYSCQNYWALNVNEQGLTFITFSDLISSNIFDATSIMGFYLGVAFTIGTILRSIVVWHGDRFYITEIPDPDPIRNLISAICMQRLEQNLKKEEELYFILTEILRSPDIIRAICGSSLRAPLVQPKVKMESSANLRA